MARTPIRRFAGSDSGAAAIEFAIIVWALLFLCLGVIEIGRGLHVRNEMSYAADLAARKILTFPKYSGQELDANCEQELRKEVSKAFTGPRPEDLTVTFPLGDGGTFRTIMIRYPFSFVIPNISESFDLTVSRRVPTGDGLPPGQDPDCP